MSGNPATSWLSEVLSEDNWTLTMLTEKFKLRAIKLFSLYDISDLKQYQVNNEYLLDSDSDVQVIETRIDMIETRIDVIETHIETSLHDINTCSQMLNEFH